MCFYFFCLQDPVRTRFFRHDGLGLYGRAQPVFQHRAALFRDFSGGDLTECFMKRPAEHGCSCLATAVLANDFEEEFSPTAVRGFGRAGP